jgi:hypothetical protein
MSLHRRDMILRIERRAGRCADTGADNGTLPSPEFSAHGAAERAADRAANGGIPRECLGERAGSGAKEQAKRDVTNKLHF